MNEIWIRERGEDVNGPTIDRVMKAMKRGKARHGWSINEEEQDLTMNKNEAQRLCQAFVKKAMLSPEYEDIVPNLFILRL